MLAFEQRKDLSDGCYNLLRWRHGEKSRVITQLQPFSINVNGLFCNRSSWFGSKRAFIRMRWQWQELVHNQDLTMGLNYLPLGNLIDSPEDSRHLVEMHSSDFGCGIEIWPKMYFAYRIMQTVCSYLKTTPRISRATCRYRECHGIRTSICDLFSVSPQCVRIFRRDIRPLQEPARGNKFSTANNPIAAKVV